MEQSQRIYIEWKCGHLGRRAQDARDLVQLVDFTVTGKERLQAVELGHDAAHREDIYRRAVVRWTEQDFRSSVPGTQHSLQIQQLRHHFEGKPEMKTEEPHIYWTYVIDDHLFDESMPSVSYRINIFYLLTYLLIRLLRRSWSSNDRDQLDLVHPRVE